MLIRDDDLTPLAPGNLLCASCLTTNSPPGTVATMLDPRDILDQACYICNVRFYRDVLYKIQDPDKHEPSTFRCWRHNNSVLDLNRAIMKMGYETRCPVCDIRDRGRSTWYSKESEDVPLEIDLHRA